jgi:hypothetical protein
MNSLTNTWGVEWVLETYYTDGHMTEGGAYDEQTARGLAWSMMRRQSALDRVVVVYVSRETAQREEKGTLTRGMVDAFDVMNGMIDDFFTFEAAVR